MTASGLYDNDGFGRLLVAVALLAVAVAVGAFVADAGDAQPDPVEFSDTVSFGVADEERFALEERGFSIPRVQVFYSQYTYVVGYEGVERAVQTLQQPEHGQQFGQPLTVYVSDYAGTDVTVTEEGYLAPDRDPGWVGADEAWFVVGSDARTAVGETIVPFSAAGDADSFAAEHGGEVVDWSTLQAYDVDLDDASAVRENVPSLTEHADERVATVRPLLDRDVSVVVGEDAHTVQEAIDAAPNGTTVLVPEGTYEEHVTIDRPVTLRGDGATVRGNGTGTVVTVTHDEATVAGLDIAGVGDQTRPDDVEGREEWDDAVEMGYGHSDAGIRVESAADVYVRNVSVDTPTSGVLFRDAPGGVVEGLAVDGTDDPFEGFMGVLSVRSPVVVQDSTFDGGRDGVYLHRAPESVIRNNTFSENRFGVHFMYTSDSLIADNVARGQTSAGITIMTGPTRNAVVGNDVRHAAAGIIPGGSRSYVAENVLAHNENGLSTGTRQSVYERNVLYGNDVGMRSGATLPSNVVRANDFVANEEHAEAGTGPLRVWTADGAGNYWHGAHGSPAGEVLDRPYSPSDPTEQRFHRTDGTVTLAESPAASALAEIRATSPGLRRGSIVDTAPLADPVRPDVVAALTEGHDDLSGKSEVVSDDE